MVKRWNTSLTTAGSISYMVPIFPALFTIQRGTGQFGKISTGRATVGPVRSEKKRNGKAGKGVSVADLPIPVVIGNGGIIVA